MNTIKGVIMLKRIIIFIAVFVLACALLVSCARSGREDVSSDVSVSSRPEFSRPDTASRGDVSEESGTDYDNASVGDGSEGIVDDIVSGAGDIVSNAADDIGDIVNGN